MVVLDTCALFWWVAMPEKLSPTAREVCQDMESRGGVVSSISFWEIGVKARKGKLDLGVDFAVFCQRVRETGILDIAPVDLATWQENLSLEWENRDPADRTIVATARLRALPLLTADEEMHAFHPGCIW